MEDREDLTFTSLSGASAGGQQTYIVEHQVRFSFQNMDN